MTVCVIIGHGTSPKGKGWGSRIDENIVVRLKDPSWYLEHRDDYGKRTDYMAASTETLPVMLDCKAVPIEYWGQPKRGKWSPVTEAKFRERAKAPLRIHLDVHEHWNPLFRSLTGTTQAECPNHSLGMAAITYVCELLKPETVLLVGFDNMLKPNQLEYHKANRGRHPSRHDWFAEHNMLERVAKHYNVTIKGFE